MKTKVVLIVLLLLGVFVPSVQSASILDIPPLFYSAVETHARIVDEQTGQPVQGAVVVAQWILAVVSGRGPTLHIAEAVTDVNGEFVIPAWGPKPRWPDTALKHFSPQIIIFKHGYQPLWLHNEALEDVAKYMPNYKNMKTKDLIRGTIWLKGSPFDPVQKSMWNGLNIQIEKFTGTRTKWVSSLEAFLNFISEEDDRDLPQLFQAIALELQRLKASPPNNEEQWGIISLSNRIKRAGK